MCKLYFTCIEDVNQRLKLQETHLSHFVTFSQSPLIQPVLFTGGSKKRLLPAFIIPTLLTATAATVTPVTLASSTTGTTTTVWLAVLHLKCAVVPHWLNGVPLLPRLTSATVASARCHGETALLPLARAQHHRLKLHHSEQLKRSQLNDPLVLAAAQFWHVQTCPERR